MTNNQLTTEEAMAIGDTKRQEWMDIANKGRESMTNNRVTSDRVSQLIAHFEHRADVAKAWDNNDWQRTCADAVAALQELLELQEHRKAAEPAGYHVIKECGKVGCSVATLEEAEKARDFWNKKWIIKPYFYAATQPLNDAEPIYQLFDMGWYDTDKQTYDSVTAAGCAGRIVYAALQPLSDAEREELNRLRIATCDHGFGGDHTHGVIGCEKCAGRMVYAWEEERSEPKS